MESENLKMCVDNFNSWLIQLHCKLTEWYKQIKYYIDRILAGNLHNVFD